MAARVIVKLPYNRPQDAPSDPPTIDWTQDKADILWQVIARSRASDSGGADWKGLAAHLEVPLPYLLYRVQARYEEELRNLQDIRSVLSPVTPSKLTPDEYFSSTARPSLAARATDRLAASTRITTSGRQSTPLGVRARLASLGHNSARPTNASTATLQAAKYTPLKPQPILPSDDDETSEDEEEAKEEEEEKVAEEQEALDKRLQDLQRMMTNEALGLVSSPHKKGHESFLDRGRPGAPRPPLSTRSYSTSTSQSISSSTTSSAQGSIPSIPSPPPSDSPMSRHMSPGKSSSPPALSPRSARGQSHLRLDTLMRQDSEHGSTQGSEASSFSDLSDASLSASALESALSNVRMTGSRLSTFARNKFAGRGGIYQ